MRIGFWQVVVVVFAALYGLSERAFLQSVASEGGAIGVWDVVLGSAFNPLPLTWIFAPAWMAATIISNRRIAGYPRLLRFGSRRRVWLASFGDGLRILVPVAVGIVVAWLLVSIGLPLGASAAVETGVVPFASLGIVPALALVCQALVVGIALLAVRSILVAARLVTGRAIVEVILALIVFAWLAVSSIGALGNTTLADAAFFTNASAVLQRPDLGGQAAVLVALVVALVGFGVALRDGVGFDARGIVAPAALAVLLGAAIVAASQGGADLVAVSTQVFFGSGSTLVQYLLPALITIGYAVHLATRLAPVGGPLAQVQVLRHGSRRQWALAAFRRELPIIAAIALGTALIAALAYILCGGSSLSADADAVAPWLVHLLVNGALQLAAYALLVLTLHVLSVGRVAQLIALAALFPVGLFVSRSAPWIPLGASALGRLTGGWTPVVLASSGLLVLCIVLAVVLTAAGSHRKWSR